MNVDSSCEAKSEVGAKPASTDEHQSLIGCERNQANLYMADLCGKGNLTKIHMRSGCQRLAEINENYLLYTGET